MTEIEKFEFELSPKSQDALGQATETGKFNLNGLSEEEINEIFDYLANQNNNKDNQIRDVRRKKLNKELSSEQRKIIVLLFQERLLLIELMMQLEPFLVYRSARLYQMQISLITSDLKNLAELEAQEKNISQIICFGTRDQLLKIHK